MFGKRAAGDPPAQTTAPRAAAPAMTPKVAPA
ncbi:MAG: hypothetical protein FD160_3444, partial [Caulobacteraceae bacterium]